MLQIALRLIISNCNLLIFQNPESFLTISRRHGTIEHDASLSRSDSYLGNNVHFNATIFSTLSESFTPGPTSDEDAYDLTSVGKALEERLVLAKKENPKLVNTVKERQSQLLEASLFLSVMGDSRTGVAPKKYVRLFIFLVTSCQCVLSKWTLTFIFHT